ncbi:MAG: ATP-grasp domain-containing protein [Bacteroidota bacterium]
MNSANAHSKAQMTIHAVVLTDEGSRGALDLLRSLAYENIEAVVASPDPHDIAGTSRFCKELIELSHYSPDTDEENVQKLKNLAERSNEKPVLFYGDDAEMMFISRKREVLSQCFHFLLPEPELAEKLVDKVQFQKLAESYNLPVPASHLVYSYDELTRISGTLKYPAFVKPAFPGSWTFDTPELVRKYRSYKHALRQFYSAEDMLDYCHDLPLENGGVLVQEFIGGSDREVFSFHGYFDEHSRVLAYFIGRKIRTYPVHHGGSAFIETVDEPTVAKICIEALQKIGFTGVTKVDLKRNPRDGSFQILEVNPRYTLWVSLGAFAGMNLPAIAYHHQRGHKVEPVPPVYHLGYKWLFFKQDLRSFFSGYWRNGEWTPLQYLASLRGKKIYQFFDWRDPMPFFHAGARFWKKNLGRIAQRVADTAGIGR